MSVGGHSQEVYLQSIEMFAEGILLHCMQQIRDDTLLFSVQIYDTLNLKRDVLVTPLDFLHVLLNFTAP